MIQISFGQLFFAILSSHVLIQINDRKIESYQVIFNGHCKNLRSRQMGFQTMQKWADFKVVDLYKTFHVELIRINFQTSALNLTLYLASLTLINF